MTTLNLASLAIDQNLAIIYVSNDTTYSQTQIENLKAKQSELTQKSAKLIILDHGQMADIGFATEVKPQQQGLLVVKQNGEVVWSKFEIDFEDLGQVMLDFMVDYAQDTTGKDIFCFGNIIPSEGDYMCNDCGYILSVTKNGEYQPGMVFPTCEVCQSGEPDGPSGAHEDFWQKL